MSTARSDETVAATLQSALHLVAPQAGSALGNVYGAYGVTDTHSADSGMSGSSAGGSRLGAFPGEDPEYSKLREWLTAGDSYVSGKGLAGAPPAQRGPHCDWQDSSFESWFKLVS